MLARIDAGAEIHRQVAVQPLVRVRRQRGMERRVAHSHEAGLERSRLVMKPVRREQRHLDLDGDDLAVDEHAVAIEDHRFRHAPS